MGALQGAVVPVAVVERGDWDPAPLLTDPHARLLVLDGLLLRVVEVGGRGCAELLAAEDVIGSAELERGELGVPCEIAFTALRETRIGVLDGPFLRRWPAVAERLAERGQRRLARLALQAATLRITRTDARLLVALWELAERFGRVGPRGVALDLGLTHSVLGQIVGAHRTSVSVALGGLADRGLVLREGGGALVLVGSADSALAACRTDNTSRRPVLARE